MFSAHCSRGMSGRIKASSSTIRTQRRLINQAAQVRRTSAMGFIAKNHPWAIPGSSGGSSGVQCRTIVPRCFLALVRLGGEQSGRRKRFSGRAINGAALSGRPQRAIGYCVPRIRERAAPAMISILLGALKAVGRSTAALRSGDVRQPVWPASRRSPGNDG
jgi:hypothetical protein